jgi:hypothetical protein
VDAFTDDNELRIVISLDRGRIPFPQVGTAHHVAPSKDDHQL